MAVEWCVAPNTHEYWLFEFHIWKLSVKLCGAYELLVAICAKWHVLTVYPLYRTCLALYQDIMDGTLPINLVCFYGIGIPVFVMDVLAFGSNKFLLSLISVYIPDEGFCVLYLQGCLFQEPMGSCLYTHAFVFLVDISMDGI